VPLDLHAVASTACAAFAAATPMRIEQLVRLAVKETQGARAPADKIARSIAATLSGLYAGNFTVDVNGRTFDHPHDVVVCEGCADVRFFLASRSPGGKRSEILGSEL
jgi:hypothetical protein